MGFHIGKAKASVPTEGFILNPKLKLPDRVSVATTQIYTHVMAMPGLGVRSPLD